MQSACTVLYSNLWRVCLHHISLHHLLNGTIFVKKIIKRGIRVLIFSTTFSETFLILRRTKWDIIIYIGIQVKWSVAYSYQVIIKLQVSWKIFEKCSNIHINPLNHELNPICYLLALLGAHHFLHVSRIRVKLLTLRRLMSYIYVAPILDVSRSHTTTQHSR